jgi:exodeoxyribonuclease VIII
MSHPLAREVLETAEETELTVLWNMKSGGKETLCKSRWDILCQGMGVIGDLKTTADASPEAFRRTSRKWGYDLQAAFYLMSAQTTDIHIEDMWFIAVEKKEPYGVGVYRIHPRDIAEAMKEVYRLLKKYRECEVNQSWPSHYNDDVQTLSMEWQGTSDFEEIEDE